MRTISVQKELSEKLRDICEDQTGRYENASACESKIIEIQNKHQTDQMLKLSKIYTLK